MLYIFAIIAVGLVYILTSYKQKITKKKQNWLLLLGGIIEFVVYGAIGSYSRTITIYWEDVLFGAFAILLAIHSVYIIFISIKGIIKKLQ